MNQMNQIISNINSSEDSMKHIKTEGISDET